MAKRQLCLYVDDNLITIAKEKGYNLSDCFNSMLSNLININEQTKPSSQDIEKKEAELTAELTKIQALKVKAKKEEGTYIGEYIENEKSE